MFTDIDGWQVLEQFPDRCRNVKGRTFTWKKGKQRLPLTRRIHWYTACRRGLKQDPHRLFVEQKCVTRNQEEVSLNG